MEQIKNMTTKDYVVDMLKKEILFGRITSKNDITQEKLAEILGVSRMPIREALITLEQEGLVERLPNRHIKVINLSFNKIDEIFYTISKIELEILNFLLNNKKENESKILILKEKIKEIIKNPIYEKETEFHMLIGEFTENFYLKQLHMKIFRGFTEFTIIHLKNKSKNKIIFFKKLLNKIDKNENIDKIIEEYYLDLSNIFKNNIKEVISE